MCFRGQKRRKLVQSPASQRQPPLTLVFLEENKKGVRGHETEMIRTVASPRSGLGVQNRCIEQGGCFDLVQDLFLNVIMMFIGAVLLRGRRGDFVASNRSPKDI